jgi:hypothetical protein
VPPSNIRKRYQLHRSLDWKRRCGTGKDSVSFLILTSALHLSLVLHLLYLYSGMREGASLAGSDSTDFGVLDLPFCLDFLSTGGADTGTSGHFDSSCSPVNFQIVFFQPGESEYKVLLPNAGDHRHCLFMMPIVSEHQLHYFLDWASFIQQSVNIIDWNRPGELMGVDSFGLHKLQVNEQA